MSRWIIDTNVPVVANGRQDPKDKKHPSLRCRMSSINFLEEVLKSGRVLVDLAGEIQKEYRCYLNPSGQPGIGDRFYLEVLNSAPTLIERIDLLRKEDGEYVDLPQSLIEVGFDLSDRKFAALAKSANAVVANATDSDWLDHHVTLEAEGISLRFICGCDATVWFEDQLAEEAQPPSTRRKPTRRTASTSP